MGRPFRFSFDIFERRNEMWLFTIEGFVSVVAHYEKPETLVVRARDEVSLIGLQEATGATLLATPKADYAFRLEVPKGEFLGWISSQVQAIDYPNFKAKMWEARPEMDGVLHDVWAATNRFGKELVTDEDREIAKRLYPNNTFDDEDIRMMKGLGYL